MKKIYLSLILSLLVYSTFATTYYSKSTGNLDNVSTWGNAGDGSGTPPPNFTNSGNIFVIINNPSATISGDWTVGAGSRIQVGDGSSTPYNFTIPATATVSGTVDVFSNGTLTILGPNIPTFGTISGTVDYSGTGSQTITAATYGSITGSTGGLTISGTRTGGATVTLPAANITVMNFTVTATGVTYVNTGNTITYGKTSGSVDVAGGMPYYNLKLSNSVGTNTAVANITVSNKLTTTSGGSFDLSTYTLGGTLDTISNAGTIKTARTGSLALPTGRDWSGTTGAVWFTSTTGGQLVPSGTYKAVNALNTSGTNTVTGGDIKVTGVFTTTATGGTLDMGANVILAGTGTITNNGTLMTQNTSATPIPSGKTLLGTVVYNAATGGQTIVSETSYINLTIGNTSGTDTLNGDLNIKGAFVTTAGGTIDFQTSNVLTVLTGGTFSITNDGIIKTSVPTSVSSTPFPSGKTYNGGGKVIYAASAGSQTVMGGTYNCMLQINNTSGVDIAANTITVNDSFRTTAGGTLNMSTFRLISSTTKISHNGILQTAATSTTNPAIPTDVSWAGDVIFNKSAGGQAIGAGTFNNLSFMNTSGSQTVLGDFAVNGALVTTSGGTLAMGTNRLMGTPTSITHNGVLTTGSTANPPFPAGDWSGSGGTSQVSFTQVNGGQFIPAGTYNAIRCFDTGGVNTALGNINVAGTFTVAATQTVGGVARAGSLDMATYTLASGGISMPTAATLYTQNSSSTPLPLKKTWGIVNYNGTGAQTLASGTFDNLILSGARTGSPTISLTSDTLSVSKSFSVTATGVGGYNPGTSTFIYTSTGSRTVGGITYYNLIFTGNQGTRTADGNVNVNNMLVTTANAGGTNGGTFSLDTFSLGGTLTTIMNNGTIRTKSTHNPALPPGLDWTGTFGLVNFAAATGRQYIPAGTYKTLIDSNTSDTNFVVGALTITNSILTASTGGTLNMGTFPLAAPLVSTSSFGTIVTQNSSGTPLPRHQVWVGPVVYNGSGDQTIVDGTYKISINLAGVRVGTPTITLSPPSDTLHPIDIKQDFFTTYTGAVNFYTTGSTVKYSSDSPGTVAPIAYGYLYVSGGNKVAAGNIEIRDSLGTSGGTFDLSTYQMSGTLSLIRNGGIIKTSSTANPALPANADWSLALGTVEFANPTGGQYVPEGTYSSIRFSNTSGVDSVVGDLVVDTTVITVDSGSTVEMGNHIIIAVPTALVSSAGGGILRTTNTSSLPFPQGITWIPNIEYNNPTGGQTIVAGSYLGGLTNSNTSGVNFVEPDSSIYVEGNLTLSAGSLLSDTGRVIYLAGNIAGTGTHIGTGRISMTTDTSGGAIVENISGASLTNLEINNTAGVMLNGSPTINGTLTLTDGILEVSNNDLVFATSATPVAGTPSDTSHIVTSGTGHAVKMFSAPGQFVYPVGDSSSYTPITLNFTSGSFGMNANAAVRVVDAKDPANANVTNYLTRYWNVTTSNITSPVYDVHATYTDADVVGTESSIAAAEFVSSLPWIRFTGANTSANTLDITGMTDTHFDLSGIASGNPIISVTPTSPMLCSGNSLLLDASGTIGADTSLTYTWTPSTGLSATTGSSVTATLSTGAVSTTATYTVTVTDGNGFSSSMPVVVTVNPAVAAVTGASSICGNATVMLSDASTGGTWSSADTTLATVDSTSGLVMGVAGNGGNAIISYTLPTGCYATTVVTVLTTPTQILGSTGLCSSTSTTLSDAISGGTWSSTNMSVATIGASDGLLNALTLGTTTISYVLSNSCYATQEVTVLSTPTPITGSPTVCDNGTTTLSNVVTGGTWTSSNTSSATVGSLSGIVSGVLIGNTTITYTLSAGCFATYDMTVLPSPAVITGTPTMCEGATTTLNDVTGSGTWSSSNTSVATVGSDNGLVTGIASNVATISYTISNGCYATQNVTVLATPTAITGTALLCTSNTTLLGNSVSGGTWSSTNTSVATIGSSTGLVNGLVAGNSTISYILGTGCYATREVTVVSTPGAITGTPTLCENATTTLANATSGGTWTSSNTSTATVGSSDGVVTGVANGVVTITYTVGSGCFVTQDVTVLTTPATITGNPTVCTGQTTTLANSVSGGTWSSSNTSFATVGVADGIVAGVGSGVTTISYILSSGCYATQDVTVSTMPAPITGTATVCENLTTTLNDATSGGTWTSSNTSLATVGSNTGLVTGVLAGNPDITYTLPGGCYVTQTLTVNQSPAAITGNTAVCLSSNVTLSNSVSGGTWTSSDGAVATVGSSDGIVNGVGSGNVTITYTLSDGCFVTQTETVYPTPGVITGSNSVCVSSNITLGNSVSGGTWSSSNTGVATVGSSTGIVTGVGTGNATISYTLPGSCGTATKVVSVGLAPNAGTISGATSVIVGSTITLTDGVSGGVWSSSNSNATVGSSTGVVTGVSAGVVTISYTVTSGCGSASATKTITVNSAVSGITGNLNVCVGSSTTLSDATPGGSWSSSAYPAVILIVPSTGVVTGVTAGLAPVTYGYPGNYAYAVVTVNPLPSPITGSNSVCLGSSTTLSSSTPGGTWTSNTPATLSIDPSTGVATGNIVGSATVTYTLPTGCIRTYTMTVKPLPSPIAGTTSLCVGVTTTLTDATSGGVSWTSSNSSVATIGSLSGVVTALFAGTTTISYNVTSGCSATTVVTVSSTLSGITGSLSVCAGFTTALGNATSGGTWSTTSSTIATIGSSTGIATGVTIGTTNVTYTIGSGCRTVSVLTVSNTPSIINGSAGICAGTTSALTSSPAGGTWSSSNTSVATVGSTGIVTGATAGTATISYTLAGGCSRTIVVTVNAAPTINGSLAICVGSSTTLTSPTAGGTWTSSNLVVATIGATTGVLAGIHVGTSNITYAVSSSCRATVVATVSTGTVSITGASAVCQGGTTVLSGSGGGTWSSSNTAIATVDISSGLVTGVSAGSVYITYSLGTGCYGTKLMTVGGALGGITGNTGLCIGATTTYISTTPSVGVGWSSSNTAIATVGALSGVVTGVGSGTATITFTPYAFSTYAGCVATKVVTVDAAPSVAPITGPTAVQVGHTITLADATPGGVWSSNLPSRATVSSTGVVTGIAVPAATISYSVTNGACVFSVTKLISVMAGRPGIEPGEGSELTIFPNPNSGTFTVKAAIGGTFTVYSLEGKEVQHSAIVEGENKITLPKDLAAGIYMCRFVGDDESSVMVRLVYENQ